ncbi:MAG: phosphate starvation-inducible protein PhoH [Planctomycetaceae bacterium]|nr:phosphate starvation-inducible protein PhoH [Planctomycetaceae bacterium]
MTEATISLVDVNSLLSLFGAGDQHIKKIRSTLGVEITHRDGKIRVAGPDQEVAKATEALEHLKSLVERRGSLADEEVTEILRRVTDRDPNEPEPEPISVLATGRKIRARTPGQIKYIKAIRDHDLTFAVGPSGTGKTYLAVALAVEALKEERIRKIVLVRPAVEAGESLGFLPGDLQAKINPYLRPLLDALHEMMDYDQIKRQMEEDVIEVVPLAYMRGRTLNEAFIILDEAQNTTVAQMKMFLTRMGTGSKIVVAGDETQLDLPPHTRSGLTDALMRLKNISGFKQIRLGKGDIVRHPLVTQIVRAYEEGANRRRVGSKQ